MREPRFWSGEIDPRSREAAPIARFLLTPLAWLYAEVTRRKIANAEPLKIRSKVICVGNLTVGGVGKSPIVSALRTYFENVSDDRVATLSRGYKGKLRGPVRVDPNLHIAADVGDEPLMLAAKGETWIGKDRAAAGQAMSNDAVDIIVMDDGHQNPGLHKDFSIIVVDATTGFGNGFVVPKGPLREPIEAGLARADVVIVVGGGPIPLQLNNCPVPIFRAKITPIEVPEIQPYVAFAGIGRPEKFFDTLTALNVDLKDAVPFPDHHVFTSADLDYLRRLARDYSATLITTEKDYVRLTPEQRAGVKTLPIQVQFDREGDLDRMLANVIKPRPNE